MKEISFKKAISIGLAAGLVIGAAAVSASATGFAKQWFADISKTAVQQELPSGGAIAPDGSAITDDGTTATTPGFKSAGGFGRHDRGGKGGHLNLESLVSDGVIDQATADKISEYIANKKDILSEMVDAGVITQAQADAITAAQPEKVFDKGLSGAGIRFEGGRHGMGTNGSMLNTDALVSSGVIDQVTADKVTAFVDAEKAAKLAEMEALRNMTESERAEYKKNKETNAPRDILMRLVDAGILTQDQADAIKATLPTVPQPGGRMGHMGRGGFPGSAADGAGSSVVPDAPEGGTAAATASFL